MPLIDPRLAAVFAPFLDLQATVYTRDGSGDFTVVAATGVASHLQGFGSLLREMAAAYGRDDRISRLIWRYDPAYALPPDPVQVVIDGERWNVLVGSRDNTTVGGVVIDNEALVERVQ